MSGAADLRFWLAVWFLVAALTLVRHWRAGLAAGLVFTYIVSFAALHWLAAAIYVLPYYRAPGFGETLSGLRLSTIAIVAFSIGGEIGAAFFRRWGPEPPAEHEGVSAPPALVNIYIVGGLIVYGVVMPVVASLPTVAALASTASSLLVLGVALKAWNGWRSGRPALAWFWLVASGVFPVVTLIVQGFLGFGFASMLVVATFVASFYRPRWQVVVAGLLVSYLGLSVYVTYMRDRREIREVVWGGETFSTRFDSVADTFGEMEWFSIRDIDHLRRVDERLNQNYLVGAAVDNVSTGGVPLAHGRTLTDSILALIPRALWPDKPMMAGSGDLVSTYTGIVFAEGTSVGIGHVMEWYVNFGTAGVAVGFMLFGLVLVYVDRSASVWLHLGDVGRFALWFLPGLSLLQIGGSFIELTSGAAAAWIVAIASNRVSARLMVRLGDDEVPEHVNP